jgi:hypothetical protein
MPVLMEALRPFWRSLVKHPTAAFRDRLERLRFRSVFGALCTERQANQAILNALQAGHPFAAARIGHTEGRIVGEWQFRYSRYGRLTRKEAHQYSGIFPVQPDSLNRFAEIYADAIANVDLLGFWQTAFQAQIIKALPCPPRLAPLRALEPYLQPQPWSSALAGKRVLVVHPFAATIERQYHENRQRLFHDPLLLPAFDLITVAPPQTLAPATAGFGDWQAAYEHLLAQVSSHHFDCALIGCGGYGLPLAAAVKAMGKQAIHLGGALQLLFGIRGRRWDADPQFAQLFNAAWVRASDLETPVAAQAVDGGCYW